jgi:hypothetical protein
MPFTDIISFLFHYHASLLYQSLHNPGMVQTALAVDDAGKIQRGRVKTESGRIVFLSVPERLSDVQHGIAIHDRYNIPEYLQDFLFGKTDEKLAHPDNVGTPVVRPVIPEHIKRIFIEAIAVSCRGYVLPGDGQLLR